MGKAEASRVVRAWVFLRLVRFGWHCWRANLATLASKVRSSCCGLRSCCGQVLPQRRSSKRSAQCCRCQLLLTCHSLFCILWQPFTALLVPPPLQKEELYRWDETDPGAGCPILPDARKHFLVQVTICVAPNFETCSFKQFCRVSSHGCLPSLPTMPTALLKLWRTYGFTPADLFITYKEKPFGWLRASLLYILSLPSHFLKTFDWNGIRRVWYGPKSEEDAVRRFGVTSMVVINYMIYRRSNIIMTVVFLGLFIVLSLADFHSKSQSQREQLEWGVDLQSYEGYVKDQLALGENATFLSYSQEVMTRAFSAVEMQSAGLAAWKAIIKMLFLCTSMAYSFFAMRHWNFLRTSQYYLYFAFAAIITFPFLITFVPTADLLDWTLSEKIFQNHLEEARKYFHADEIVASCMLNDPLETFEVARPVIEAVCPVLQQRVPYVMPGVVRVKVLGQPVSVTIKSWLPWLADMVPEGTNLKPIHRVCDQSMNLVDSNVTADLAATASDVCKSLATFLYKNVPPEASTALTELREALRQNQQDKESTEQAVYQLHFVDKVEGLEAVPLRLFSRAADNRLDGLLVRPGGDPSGCGQFLTPPSVYPEDAVLVVGPLERGGRGACNVRHILQNADKVGARAVVLIDPKRTVRTLPSAPRVTVGVIAYDLDGQAILYAVEKQHQKAIRVVIRFSPVFGLQRASRTSAGCLCKGMGYDSDCRVRPADLLTSGSGGRSPYPWCETAEFDYWGALCKKDFDLCVPPGEGEAFERPGAGCKTSCGRHGDSLHDYCYVKGSWIQVQRCVAALGVSGRVERPGEQPEDFEGSILNFAGAMSRFKASGRLLTLTPSFLCVFRVATASPSGGKTSGQVHYSSTASSELDWQHVADVNEEFITPDSVTEIHFEVAVEGVASKHFDAVRLEQRCGTRGSGQLGNWSLVPHGQLRIPTLHSAAPNVDRRLRASLSAPAGDDEGGDGDGDGKVKLSTCSEFVGIPCIDPGKSLLARCSDNQVCDSNFTAGGGFCRCADGFCWSYIKQGCVDQSEHARELVSKLLDETMLERHSPKLWATAKEIATAGFCAMEAAESLNNILRHVLAIGPGILISAWTAKLIFVHSTVPGYFSYFFTMVYSPGAWVLNNVFHQTAADWRLSLGLAAMAFWTIPVSLTGMKYGLHRPMSVARAMSLVNNLLLLYYFILFAGVVFIVMFVMGSETEGDEYFSVRATFRRQLRPGKLSKGQLFYHILGLLTESFAVFFITCCAATDAFIMVITKEHEAAWSLVTRGSQAQASLPQASAEEEQYAIEERVTRDWLLLMKEFSEQGEGARRLTTRLLRDDERSSGGADEAVELTDMVRLRQAEMEQPSLLAGHVQESMD
ncbi:PSF2 [Symbiodinium natans]|uniref:PSF2 protein n=1 Tax=Symbiodinium natans TaxID=878477 RepID=A0A812NG31_9DINO|nr:PSF2 [Symbiodinium natans]